MHRCGCDGTRNRGSPRQTIQASNLISTIKPLRAACQFDHVRGYGRANLGSEDFWQTLSAGLHLEDGSIPINSKIFNSSFAMNDIQAHLFIHQGEVDHSLVTLQVGGLKGKMDVEWGRHKQVLTFKLDGIAEDTAGLLPPCFMKDWQRISTATASWSEQSSKSLEVRWNLEARFISNGQIPNEWM